MVSMRQSNIERRRARDECREKLSKHIHQRLGIKVKAADVRLNPRLNDPYAWRILPGEEHSLSRVFVKNLSDHSIGTFRLLCREIGKTFEAVLSSTQSSSLDSIVTLSVPEPSFSVMINELREENARLYQEVYELKSKARVESGQKKLVEEENCKLRSSQM
ncbi:hypothetical protein B0T26DRAFT_795827 [Lasiosphaeria miniovina]|uniref:Uncharacterized protein n=1 Tax=Lasiosphaeria miniovina TaxID=1954250 RepID=A0AA39ZQR2_9PEZI|nr:uncharacterized protein B0T26DRAFT_795827 [Lasiosphaeria miniovina]KAK0701939.1 hypothetical protein B0T26DRAFT_795827 [Lasiosphaeria miniovina]